MPPWSAATLRHMLTYVHSLYYFFLYLYNPISIDYRSGLLTSTQWPTKAHSCKVEIIHVTDSLCQSQSHRCSGLAMGTTREANMSFLMCTHIIFSDQPGRVNNLLTWLIKVSFIADTMSRIVFVNNQIFAWKTRRDTKQRKYGLFWLARRAVQKIKLLYFVICESAARPTHRVSHNVDLMIFIQLSGRIAYLPIKVSLWPKAQRDASIWF